MWLLYAMIAAILMGFRSILYQWTSRKPIDRNLLLLGVYLSGTSVAMIANVFAGQTWSAGAWVGLVMGFFSYTANASMYRGFAVGKTSLIAMLTALSPVVVVCAAYALWGEKLNAWQMVSFVVIVAGIIMIRYSNDISLSNLQGAQWGLLAMVAFGLTDLSSKQALLLGAKTLPALAVMFGTGSLLFFLSWVTSRIREQKLTGRLAVAAAAAEDADRKRQDGTDQHASDSLSGTSAGMRSLTAVQWSIPRTLLWGLVVGLTNIFSMMLVLPAFKIGITGLVSAVLASNVLLVLLYARIALQEKFVRLEIGGMACTILGIVILRLAG
jgi:uncharacterized membrane protein